MRPNVILGLFGSVLVACSTPDSRCDTERDASTCEDDLATAQADLATAQAATTAAESDLTACESDLTACESDLDDCETDLATAETDLATAQAEVAAKTASLGTCEGSLATAVSNLSSCDSSLATSASDLSTCSGALTTCESDLEASVPQATFDAHVPLTDDALEAAWLDTQGYFWGTSLDLFVDETATGIRTFSPTEDGKIQISERRARAGTVNYQYFSGTWAVSGAQITLQLAYGTDYATPFMTVVLQSVPDLREDAAFPYALADVAGGPFNRESVWLKPDSQ